MTDLKTAFSHSAASTRTAFDIGHDFAFYRLHRPDTLCDDVLAGFEHKKQHGGTTRKSTPSIRKWLNLRLHAYERKIHIDENITPDLIDTLFEETGGVCPITREIMTVGTMTDTDWSIDRIINDYGYVRQNITVMSTRANKAKGQLSVDEIKAIRDTRETHNGLTYAHWSALYSLVFRINRNLQNLDDLKEIDITEFNADIVIDFIDTVTDPFSMEDNAFINMSACIAANTHKKNIKALRRALFNISKRRNRNEPLVKLIERSSRLKKQLITVCQLVDWQGVIADLDETRQEFVEEYDRVISAKRL